MKTAGVVLDLQRYVSQDITPAPPAATWADVSRYKRHGTINGATWTRLPSGLWVLSFNGVNQNVTLASVLPTISEALPLTILIAFYPTGAVGSLVNSNRSNNNRFTALQNVGELRIYFYDGGVYRGIRSIASSLNTWHIAIYTFEPVGHSGVLLLDGVIAVGSTNSGSDGTVGTRFGEFMDGSVDYTGMIGMIKTWKYIFTLGQMSQLFESERGWFGI